MVGARVLVVAEVVYGRGEERAGGVRAGHAGQEGHFSAEPGQPYVGGRVTQSLQELVVITGPPRQ
jgi:hypothetical protein